jgi:hypothetical protein
MLIQLKGKDIAPLRKRWWEQNGKICPITQKEIPLSDAVVDHQHKLKAELADETGKGLCRGVLSRSGNAWEGKVTNSFKRLGLHNYVDIVSALRNLADYLECNHIHTDEEKYIHPSDAPKKIKLSKRSYNKLKTIAKKDPKAKMDKFPKYTGNLTKPLTKLFKKYEVEPEFYGDK